MPLSDGAGEVVAIGEGVTRVEIGDQIAGCFHPRWFGGPIKPDYLTDRLGAKIVERTGMRWFAAELNRHKGQLLLRQGHTEAAEQLYRRALSIAAEQEAKLWELRAAASLARLRRDQGRDAEALDLLAPVYGWFTEGFATPDLKEAKALLDELT